MADHDELIAQFIEVSGGDEDVAKFYLSSSNWDLENAIANFLGSQSEDNDDMANNAETAQPAAARNATTTENAAAAAKPAAEDFAKTAKGAKPKFATLQDMSNRPADEEEGQAFYAGGSERSGQQVLGPPKRKNFREQLTEMFRMAQEQSPETIDTHLGPSTSAAPQAGNWGQGVRLGMTSSDHAVVAPANAAGTGAAGGQKKPVVVLKLWSQGFSIDDGELRLYDDPQNKEFLETVMRGEIPHELLEMGWMVNVDVEDHRQEDYKKTTPKQTFKGSGHALGSPTPNIVETAPTSVPAPSTAAAAKPIETTEQTKAENLAKEQLKLDASAPTTTLQIRLADGSRLSSQFNLTHTVADIQQYIRNARPQYAERNFILVSSFPTRELSDNAATVESAGLKNAALMQRLK